MFSVTGDRPDDDEEEDEPILAQLDEDDSDKLDESVVQANIAAFVQRLRLLAPRARECAYDDEFSSRVSRIDNHRLNRLLSLILENMDSLECACSHISLTKGLDFDDRVCNLTSIDYDLNCGLIPGLKLVRQCAPILQSLQLWFSPSNVHRVLGRSGLILDSHSNGIVYPCLNWLGFETWYREPEMGLRPKFRSLVPFPALRHIRISYYGFGDDTLFRGNAATLENLCMRMDTDTVAMLRRCQVFTHNSHPHLRSVTNHGSVDLAACGFDTSADYLQFLLSIGPDATLRDISCGLSEQDIPRSLKLLGEHSSSIRALTFRETCFTYLDVIALIKSLPQLSYLSVDIPKRGAQLADIPTSQLFDTLIKTHAPMGKQLWHLIIQKPDEPGKELVEFAVLLTSLCPNLDHVSNSPFDSGPIGKHMRECADLPPLQKYEQVLQRMTCC
ncbi:hypothetical protein GGI21_004997 [Coemansia aciculifera]|nr:hypothetical protein GGI21_004997 [Coemansia aciculifera]